MAGELDNTKTECTFDNETSIYHHKKTNDYFSNQNLTREKFLNSKWSYSLLNVIHTYSAILAYCEAFDGNENMICSEKDQINPPWNPDFLAPTRRLLEKNLHRISVSVEELRQKFGKEVASLYSLSVQHRETSYDDTVIATNVDIIRTLFIGDRQICYQVGLEAHYLTPKSDFMILVNDKDIPAVIMKSLRTQLRQSSI